MFWLSSALALAAAPLLVDITTVAPSVQVDARYFSDFNFLGHRVRGYEAGKCLLTPEAATALAAAEKSAGELGFKLLIFDCYRPQRAVNEFVEWVKGKPADSMKAHFFPDEDRTKLIAHGYIDAHSGH